MDEATEMGVIFINKKDGGFYRFSNDFQYYTLQGPFLVIAMNDGSVQHFSVDTIENFQYTPKETN